MTTLLCAEHDNVTLHPVTSKALTAALALGEPVHLLVIGDRPDKPAEAAARLAGVEKVIIAEDPGYAHPLAEPVSALIIHLASAYAAIVAPATAHWKSVLPRVAASLDVMQVSDVVKILGPDTFERPIYAGNAIQVVRSNDPKRVLTIRTAAFASAGDGGNAPKETVAADVAVTTSRFLGEEISSTIRPELSAARVIVSGGRALGSAEGFRDVIEPLADALGAAVGASRAAVDAGYAPNDLQVGQTGKVVAPELYVAAGISGAIQHLAGMKDSKIIVAVNKDEEAPIFQVADYGLVGDLFEVIPALTVELAKSGR
ncbi:electron transfer flavoprotein subunit alpha/FixB family protein [Xanthobacteraceae bacterium A53D]